MKLIKTITLAAAAMIAATSIANAQTFNYGQLDVGAAMPSGQLGEQLVVGLKAGSHFSRYFSAELGLSQQWMTPSTYLGGVNSTEFSFVPYARYEISPGVVPFAGPQIGATQVSGSASTNNLVGTYGAVVGIEFRTGWNDLSIVPTYTYTRSMTPAVVTGPGYTDYYNNNKFTVGLRKTF